MKTWVALAVVCVGVAADCCAARVSQGDAARAVERRLPGRRAARVRTFDRMGIPGAPLFHVVALEGGGFVVTAADTGVAPIIAIAEGEDLDVSERNPLWALLNRDLAGRMDHAAGRALPAMTAGETLPPEMQWGLLLAEPETRAPGVPAVADVRVAPLVLAKWNQGVAWTSSGWKNVYNYYTPDNYVCGCVATAGAQVMRHHAFPTDPVPAQSHMCWVSDVASNLTMQGGVYDWENMPPVLTASITDTEREAIGRLTYDLGVATRMQYNFKNGGGSAAFNFVMIDALTNVFGYASALTYLVSPASSAPANNVHIRNALLATLDADQPAVLGISGNGGHSIVADGYGYNAGVCYVHLNMGWGGSQDAWYNFEALSVSSSYNFTLFDDVSYNISPAQQGEWITGRTLDEAGQPLPGSAVTARNAGNGLTYTAASNAKGIYAILVPSPQSTGDSYGVSATNGTWYCFEAEVSVGQSKTCVYAWKGASMGWSNRGQVGNRWGNDLTLDQAISTQTTYRPVPHFWLDEMYPGNNGDYETLAEGLGANGLFVWQSYVAGLEPTNAASRFKAVITFTNSEPFVAWAPDLRPKRAYKVLGNATLDPGGWVDVNVIGSDARFFKVRVDLPGY